jgi:hypothetical protein
VRVGREPGTRRRQVAHYVDADRRAAEAGLDDVGAFEAHVGGRLGEGDALEDRQAGGGHHGPEGQFVHPNGRPGEGGAGVGDPGQVECALERAVLPGGPVAADDRGGQLDRLGLGEAAAGGHEAAVGTDGERQGSRPLRDALDEGGRLEGRVDLEPLAELRPVEGPHPSAG